MSGTVIRLVPAGVIDRCFAPLLSKPGSQETAGIPGITFTTSHIGDDASKQYHLSKTGGKWGVHEISLGDGQWTDEIVALETDFVIQTNTKYTDLGKSRLLRDFMKFVLRISAHAARLTVNAQFPQSYRQTLQDFYHLCRYWEEDPEECGTLPGVNGQITPSIPGGVNR